LRRICDPGDEQGERKREIWLLLGFGEESFRFFFSCVDCGVSNLTEEEEDDEEEACLSCAAKRSVVLCFVCFLRSCFSCGGEKEFGEERELKIES